MLAASASKTQKLESGFYLYVSGVMAVALVIALRLRDTHLVEGDVGRALEARLGVPGGLPVTPEHDASGGHASRSRCATTDSGNGSRAPSFHSRSRP